MNFKDYYLLESFNDNAYVFDVDDTLVTTGAKIIVKDPNGNIIKKLSPHDYNTYQRAPGEQYDFSEFQSADIFRKTAQPTKYFKVIKTISDAIKEKRSNSFIYILTARGSVIKNAIHKYLTSNGIEVRMADINTIGDDPKASVADLKKQVLQKIRNKHIGKVVFFDDDEKNIQLAKQVKGVDTRLV